MKKNFICWVLLASFSLTTACGSDSSVLGVPQRSAQEVNPINEARGDIKGEEAASSFELARDLQVQSLENSQSLLIPAGTQISILENSSVDGKDLVRLGLEYSSQNVDETSFPQDIWISSAELAQADLRLINDTDPYDEDGNELSLNEFARKKMTYCYRYVKQYLLSHGMVKVYLPGASAWMAAAELPKHGFKKSSRRASNAIVNDVCVYKGGPSGHGHIEIRTAKGWYYGYGYKANPIQNRIFMGCFHK